MDNQSDKPSVRNSLPMGWNVATQMAEGAADSRCFAISAGVIRKVDAMVISYAERLAAGAPSPVAEQAKCETCRFRGGVGQFYDCRRHAPISFRERGGVLEARWPQVESHHWCWDHEPEAAPPSLPPEPDTRKAYPVVGVGKDLQAALPARSAKDYAIEHAGYMATAAKRLLGAINEEDRARITFDFRTGPRTGAILDARMDTRCEMTRALRNDIYEFEKRRDRAASEARVEPTAGPSSEPPRSNKPDSSSASASPDAQAIEVLQALKQLASEAGDHTNDSFRRAVIRLANRAHSLDRARSLVGGVQPSGKEQR